MSDVQGAEGFERVRAKLMSWAAAAPNEVKGALTQAAELVRKEAQQAHLSGPKMPRGIGDDENATLAVQTGTLRRSISNRIRVAMGEVSAEVGTTVAYGKAHELGEGKMPERPFLASSLRKKHKAVFELIRERFFKGYGKNA